MGDPLSENSVTSVMKVVWKRPDGFLHASPDDYKILKIRDNVKIWLHKNDKDHYPFRIYGGWQDEQSTLCLNNLINLLPESVESLESYLLVKSDDSRSDFSTFLQEILTWIEKVEGHLKGDTWEIEIMQLVLDEVQSRIKVVKNAH